MRRFVFVRGGGGGEEPGGTTEADVTPSVLLRGRGDVFARRLGSVGGSIVVVGGEGEGEGEGVEGVTTVVGVGVAGVEGFSDIIGVVVVEGGGRGLVTEGGGSSWVFEEIHGMQARKREERTVFFFFFFGVPPPAVVGVVVVVVVGFSLTVVVGGVITRLVVLMGVSSSFSFAEIVDEEALSSVVCRGKRVRKGSKSTNKRRGEGRD